MESTTEHVRAELMQDVQNRVQRLRELRDMTQDREEGRRLDAKLRELQLTLYDLEHMDDAGLRRAHARTLGKAASATNGTRASQAQGAARDVRPDSPRMRVATPRSALQFAGLIALGIALTASAVLAFRRVYGRDGARAYRSLRA